MAQVRYPSFVLDCFFVGGGNQYEMDAFCVTESQSRLEQD